MPLEATSPTVSRPAEKGAQYRRAGLLNQPPAVGAGAAQPAKTTLFAGGPRSDVRQKRRRRLLPN
jgi:hypothetical protein